VTGVDAISVSCSSVATYLTMIGNSVTGDVRIANHACIVASSSGLNRSLLVLATQPRCNVMEGKDITIPDVTPSTRAI
jgi:hypothetical protein